MIWTKERIEALERNVECLDRSLIAVKKAHSEQLQKLDEVVTELRETLEYVRRMVVNNTCDIDSLASAVEGSGIVWSETFFKNRYYYPREDIHKLVIALLEYLDLEVHEIEPGIELRGNWKDGS